LPKRLVINEIEHNLLFIYNDITYFTFMKKITFLFTFVVLIMVGALAQPKMMFEQTTIDYGKIEKGSEPVRKFKFKNTGISPLIIQSAKGSCGCTVPTYSKEPIMPGESSTIDVRYDTQRVGAFTKNVTITTNDNETILLTITGEVKSPPSQESVPLSPSGLE